MSRHWEALVLNDYEMVMPLTWNRKYFVYYLYQPFFCAQLGIFGNGISAAITEAFLKSIPRKFRYWDFYLNKGNLFDIPGFPMYKRVNYTMSLQPSYEELYHHYAQSHKRNIRRALDSSNFVKSGIEFVDIIALARQQAKTYSPIRGEDYDNFENLLLQLREKHLTETYGVFNRQHQLMASCTWVFSHRRAYYILVGNHPDGRTSGASHLLIDHFIKKHAGQDLILAFEGSNRPSLAFFYKSFGSSPEIYPGIRFNELPLLLQLFKQ